MNILKEIEQIPKDFTVKSEDEEKKLTDYQRGYYHASKKHAEDMQKIVDKFYDSFEKMIGISGED